MFFGSSCHLSGLRVAAVVHKPDWQEPHARVTQRLARRVYRFRCVPQVRHMALDWITDERWLSADWSARCALRTRRTCGCWWLAIIDVLKDDAMQLRACRSEALAREAWQGREQRARRRGLQPLRHLARCPERCLPRILAHCRWLLGSTQGAGIGKKIEVIKRMACGFCDDASLILGIRAAFTGLG